MSVTPAPAEAWLQPPTLTGRLVELVPLTLEHAPALAAAGADPSIWTWLGHAPLSTVDLAAAFIRRALDQTSGEPPQAALAVVALPERVVAGSTRYQAINPLHRNLEIAWTWYAPRFQRTAVNTECKLLMLTHAFETLGALRVQFKTDQRNERSQQALLRIGAVREGVFRKHRIRLDGSIRDSVYFSITDQEWPAVRQRLHARLETSGGDR